MSIEIVVGKVRPVMRGAYSDTALCEYYDCYWYDNVWWLHIGKEATVGVTPEVGNVWTMFGVKGDKGDPFSVGKTYPSVEAMLADDSDDIAVGTFVVITTGSVEDEDNAKLYVRATDGEGDNGTNWAFITDMSGAQGIKGDAATIKAGTVTMVDEDEEASVTNVGTANDAVFDFVIPRGIQGESASVDVGTVTTVSPGTPASVINSGTVHEARLDFAIPQGERGEPGESVTAAYIDEQGMLKIKVE